MLFFDAVSLITLQCISVARASYVGLFQSVGILTEISISTPLFYWLPTPLFYWLSTLFQSVGILTAHPSILLTVHPSILLTAHPFSVRWYTDCPPLYFTDCPPFCATDRCWSRHSQCTGTHTRDTQPQNMDANWRYAPLLLPSYYSHTVRKSYIRRCVNILYIRCVGTLTALIAINK